MTKLRKITSKGYRSRQERALAQRREELIRYQEGDFLDCNGYSLIDSYLPSKKRRNAKDRKIRLAEEDIRTLERRLGQSALLDYKPAGSEPTFESETTETFVGLELN